MNKALDVVFVALGIVSIFGSVFFMYGLTIFDSALNDVIGFDEATASNFGLDIASAQQMARQVKGLVTLAWTWAAVVVAGSLALIYYAASDMRRKKK